MRWARAARLERPCFRRVVVRPKAAGALWIIRARKMMNDKLRPLSDGPLEDEAPRAIPSAHAWITSPTVVEEGREEEPCEGW